MQSSAPDRHKFFRSAGIVSAAVLLSRITGMVREVVMARFFGAGAANDAFQLAFRIPSLTRNLFAEGALSSALVPVFTRSLASEGKQKTAELSSIVATTVVLVVGPLCVLGMIFSPQLVRLLAPGFQQVPGKFELTVLLNRIMFPFLLLVALAAQAMAALNASGSFGVPALASSLFNVGSVACGLALGYTVGRRAGNGMIVSMAYGVLAGGALQLLWQLPSMWRAGFRFRPRVDWRHPGLRQIVRMMGPAVLGNAALQVNVVVNSNLASSITDASGHVIDGPVSWLGYAFRFLQLPVGLFGVAIASATLPSISRSFGMRQMDEFRETLARSLGTILLLTIPSSVGLAVMGESMIATIYQGGPLYGVRHASNRAGAYLLQCGTGGVFGAQDAGECVLRARRRENPHVGKPGVDRHELRGIVWDGEVGRHRTRGAGALHGSGSGIRLGNAAGGVTAAAGWHWTAQTGRQCRENRSVGGADGSRLQVFERAGSRRDERAKPCSASRCGDFGALGVAVFYAAAKSLRTEEVEAMEAACYTAFRK